MLPRLTLLSGRYRLRQGCTCSSCRPSLLISVSLTWSLDRLISHLAQSTVASGTQALRAEAVSAPLSYLTS